MIGINVAGPGGVGGNGGKGGEASFLSDGGNAGIGGKGGDGAKIPAIVIGSRKVKYTKYYIRGKH